MKYLLILSITFNIYFLCWLFLLPIGIYPQEEIHEARIQWYREPEFVTSMIELREHQTNNNVSAYNIRRGRQSQIIQTEPTNRLNMMTFGHECLHAFGWTHE